MNWTIKMQEGWHPGECRLCRAIVTATCKEYNKPCRVCPLACSSKSKEVKEQGEAGLTDDMDLPKGRTCRSCSHIPHCKKLFGCEPENTKCDWSPCRYAEYHGDMTPEPIFMREVCEALGWQGGTVHEVIKEIKKLKSTPAHVASGLREVEKVAIRKGMIYTNPEKLSTEPDKGMFQSRAWLNDNTWHYFTCDTKRECDKEAIEWMNDYRNFHLTPSTPQAEKVDRTEELVGRLKYFRNNSPYSQMGGKWWSMLDGIIADYDKGAK